jgi:hypothetical protein
MGIRKFMVALSLSMSAILFTCSDKGTEPPGNQAPSISSSSSVQAVIDQQFSYTATASDPDGTTPTVTIDNNPSWTSVNSRTITGTPTQGTPDTTFRVIASDGELADTLIVTIDVVTSQPLISYAAEIQPIFNNNCAGAQCHIPGPANGLSLNNYAQLMQGGNSGAVVLPGNPDGSIIVRRLEGTITPRMPLNGPPYLSASEIQLIRDWIEQGALEN